MCLRNLNEFQLLVMVLDSKLSDSAVRTIWWEHVHINEWVLLVVSKAHTLTLIVIENTHYFSAIILY
jgi:hypothetical protein